MMDIDLLLDSATPAETTVALCLNGKLRAQYETLRARIEERAAEQADGDDADTRLAGRGRKPKADPEQADLDRLVEEMKAHTITCRLVALPRPEFNQLMKDHPGRKDDKTGRPIERFNAETLFPVLLRKALVEPVLSPAQYDKLLNAVNEAQYDKLVTAAWNLNHEDSDVPF